ncbi:hypothetical protein NA57DRAFT_35071 [Rhizodiscina lignyota]|uniref:TMEM205-like domain-containing protein n=1 Tax=Rhizodiscina lignyota TaxID=1504668 RepID=A0A9P4M8A4_9PEZI|nr:hypothetical protein NA57DRAFT_35071 [Rhizodiscina lignyota]
MSFQFLLAPGPYHLLSYGTLLGSTLFQSFIGGIIAFRVLPRSSFSQLQQATFPTFFAMQSFLPVAMALTYPGARLDSVTSSAWHLGYILREENRWSVAVPIGVMLVTGLANWLWIGPETTRVMRERKHQETRDGKKAHDKGPQSPEMQKLNKSFMRLHGASTLVNLSGFVAMVAYGFTLGARL